MTISNNELTSAIKILKSAKKNGETILSFCKIENNFAYFCDGHRTVRFPVDCEDKLVSLETLESALKYAKIKKELVDFKELSNKENIKIYPNIHILFESPSQPVEVSFDPHYLKELCEMAIAAQKQKPKITFRLTPPDKGSEVRGAAEISLKKDSGDLTGLLAVI